MDSNIKHYFDIHINTHTFYFTSDGLAFFKPENASNHAQNLADKKIDTITRAEVDEWWNSAAPEQVIAAEQELEAANFALSNAQNDLAGLPPKTPIQKKAVFSKAVNEAKARVDAATLALEVAREHAAKLTVEPEEEDTDTRSELEKATDQVKEDQQALEAANTALEAANKAKNELPSDATGSQKTAATKAVTKATTAVSDATTALEASQKILDELNAVNV